MLFHSIFFKPLKRYLRIKKDGRRWENRYYYLRNLTLHRTYGLIQICSACIRLYRQFLREFNESFPGIKYAYSLVSHKIFPIQGVVRDINLRALGI